jgi:hypothetical protein
MKQLAPLALSIAVLAAPLRAEEPPQDAPAEGRSLMEQGMELFFEGLRDEMSPALRDLRDLAGEYGPQMRSFFQQMGPALGDLMSKVDDWSRYELPEVLPNGDVIIRRKADAPPYEPTPDTDDDETPAGPTDI